MRGFENRAAVTAATLLVLVVVADAVRGHVGGESAPTTTESAPSVGVVPRVIGSDLTGEVIAREAVPSIVALRGSPETMFLETCAARNLRLRVTDAPAVTLAYRGPPCHLPPLALRAVLRDHTGAVLYRGPALAGEPLSRNFAGSGTASAPLLPEALRCRSSKRLPVRVAGGGLSARGVVRCRGAF